MNWSELTKIKLVGGLGFKDFNDMNSAMLVKQAWTAIHNPQSIWVRILQAISFPNSEFVRAKRGTLVCDNMFKRNISVLGSYPFVIWKQKI